MKCARDVKPTSRKSCNRSRPGLTDQKSIIGTHRANMLKAQEDAGKSRSNLNSANARQRADELADRLKKRMAELEQERSIVARPPTVLGGALVVPAVVLRSGATVTTVRETPRTLRRTRP